MLKSSLKFVTLAAAIGALLAAFPMDANAAKKKHRAKSAHHHSQKSVHTQRRGPTPAEYNWCVHNQVRYPTLDIRC